jgi:hypothetical protein
MSVPLSQHRGSRRVLFNFLISWVLSFGVIAAGMSLNLVGHAKFIQTDRVLLVPIGKTVWSYGWPFRWMEKDVAEVEKSDGVYRTRWGIHHKPYDWVTGKYRLSESKLGINILVIISLLLGCLWAENRSIAVKWMKRNPIAILLCCLVFLWRLFVGASFFADPIEFKLLRGIEFATCLTLFAFAFEIVVCLTRWIRQQFA